MNKRILTKQVGLKSTMKLRDYIEFRLDEDRIKDFEFLKEEVDIKYGDAVVILTFEPPKLKNKRKLTLSNK